MKYSSKTIFRRLMNWLDSWDDRINPITVRELRCVANIPRIGSHGIGLETTLFMFLLVFAGGTIVILKILDLEKKSLETFFSSIDFTILYFFWNLFPVSMGLQGITRSRCIDNLLNIIPLSPQQQVHGYWAVSCIWSVFLNSLILPFLAIGQIVGVISYIQLLIPLGAFLLSQIITLVGFSFIARMKHYWEIFLLGATIFYVFPACIIVPWFGVLRYFQKIHGQFPDWNDGFGFVSLFILLPVVLLLLGFIAYRLSVYGFKTWQKPLWQSILLNLLVYTLFNIVIAFLWLGFSVI